MTKKVLLYFALLLWFVVPVTAQPTIFVEDTSVDLGDKVNVEIKVSDFVDIVSMQFSVNWDSSVFQYDTISVSNVLPDFSAANFGTSSTDNGKLTTSWFEQSLNGVNPADSSTVFTIHLNTLVNTGTTSDIAITDDPIIIEVSNENSEILEVTTETGTVTVLNPTGIDDLYLQSNKAFALYQNEPNPFDNQTVIRFDVYEPSNFVLEVYDAKGTIIHTENAHYFSGNQSITLEAEVLPTVGMYFYKLKTKDYFITNRMILVRK